MRYNLIKIVQLLALSHFINAEFDDGITPKTVEVHSPSKTIPTTTKVITKVGPVRITTLPPKETVTNTEVFFKDSAGEFASDYISVPLDADDIAVLCKDYTSEDVKSPDTVCDYDMNCFKLYKDFYYGGSTNLMPNMPHVSNKCFLYTSKKSDPKPDVSEYTTPIDICRGETHVSTGVYDSVISSNTYTTIMNDNRSISAYTMYITEKPFTTSTLRCKPYTNNVSPITSSMEIKTTTTPTPTVVTTTTRTKILQANMKTMTVHEIYHGKFIIDGIPQVTSVVEAVITVPKIVNKVYVDCTMKYPPVYVPMGAASPLSSSSSGASSGTKIVPSIDRRSQLDYVICDEVEKTDCYRLHDISATFDTDIMGLPYEKERCEFYTQLEEDAIPTTSVVYSSLCRPYTHTSTKTTYSFLGQSCTTITGDIKTVECTNSYDLNLVTSSTIDCSPETTTNMVITSTKAIPEITTTTTTKTIPLTSTDCPPVTVTVTENEKSTVTEKVTVTVSS